MLPAFFKEKEKGEADDDALEKALKWVNNLSKRKFHESIDLLRRKLFTIEEPTEERGEGGNSFLLSLEDCARRTVNQITPYTGVYLSYSIASGCDSLKIEPYLVLPSENGKFVEFVHTNALGTTHRGIALMNEASHLYLTFNESHFPRLALFQICLKLPLYERPPFLRGVYQCFDYNFNPIARRILFVKQTESTDREAFSQLCGMQKEYDELNDDERCYYDYTCRQGDVIRLCNILTSKMDNSDLVMEKKILDILKH